MRMGALPALQSRPLTPSHPRQLMALDYLQRGFLGTVWPQAVDLLSNEIIHNAFVDADRRGFDLRVSDTSLNMSALPLFSLLNGQLKLRMPGTGSYGFRTRVLK